MRGALGWLDDAVLVFGGSLMAADKARKERIDRWPAAQQRSARHHTTAAGWRVACRTNQGAPYAERCCCAPPTPHIRVALVMAQCMARGLFASTRVSDERWREVKGRLAKFEEW